jgi:membrane protein
VRLHSCIIPGILAGVSMQVLQMLYIHSQIWMSSYNAIYGSFAALPLFMLWVQISWTITLFGAELCYTNQNLDYYDYNTRTDDISHRYRMLLSTILMSRVCRRFMAEKKPYTASELREETKIPIRITNDLLYNMVGAGLLAELTSDEKGDTSRFIPAVSVEQLSYGMLIDRMEAQGKWRIDLPMKPLNTDQWRRILRVRKDFLMQGRDILLKDL